MRYLLILLFFAGAALADDAASKPASKPASRPGTQSRPQVLDFEADVIEGERRKPDMFIQIGADKQSMEGLIYGRKHFNDFHRIDRVWRPAHYELKPRKKGETK